MRLLLASNQPAEALKEFREFSRRLEANFGNHSSLFSARLTALAEGSGTEGLFVPAATPDFRRSVRKE
jgi:hypothetical protein